MLLIPILWLWITQVITLIYSDLLTNDSYTLWDGLWDFMLPYYWAVAHIFVLLDHTGCKKTWLFEKIHESNTVYVNHDEMYKIIVRNQILLGVCGALLSHYEIITILPPSNVLQSSSIMYDTFHVAALGMVYALFFDICHYQILHGIRCLYSYHEIHHNTHADYALTSMVMHPIDAFFEIIVPLFACLWVSCLIGYPPSIATIITFLITITIYGNVTHSGYRFRFYLLPDPAHHIRHHEPLFRDPHALLR